MENMMDPRMTERNGEVDTPPDGLLARHDADIAALKRTVQTAADASLECKEEIGALTREIAQLRIDMQKGFDRIGRLADAAFRNAETSSHDLSEFKTHVRKAILMKLNWPSAIVLLAFVIAAFVFPYFHIQQPEWLIALEIAVGGIVLNQFKPAVTTADKAP